MTLNKRIKALSLFANVGIAETYLKEIGIDVVVANELDPKRTAFYSHLYPETTMIEGDITDSAIKQLIIQESKAFNVELILATPPCQGMSTAGKMDKWDARNILICHAIEIVKEVRPKYVFFENVPQQLSTKILHDGEILHIPECVKRELQSEYIFNDNYLVEAADYGIPQFRKRAIMLLVRRDIGKQWNFPEKTGVVTLEDAIGDLPSLDPEIYDLSRKEMLKIFPDFDEKKAKGLSISKWHYPPKHVYRQVVSMMYTPTGNTAFDNVEQYQPRKKDGQLAKGFRNTYTRQHWDRPGTTVTMYNRQISSQGNVHPGRLIGKDSDGYELYSDARVMSIYELMIMSSLPKNWDIPDGVTDNFIGFVIGEGIPPLLVKKIMEKMMEIENE